MKHHQPRIVTTPRNAMCKTETYSPRAALDFIWVIATLLGTTGHLTRLTSLQGTSNAVDISVIPNGKGLEIPYASSGSSTYECVGPLQTFHTFSPLVSPSIHLPCPCLLLLVLGVWCGCCFVVFLFLVLQVFSNPEFSAHIRPG